MFIVGEIVKIVDSFEGHDVVELDIVDDMLQFAGMEAVVMCTWDVVDTLKGTVRTVGYALDIDEGQHIWDINLLSPAPSEEPIEPVEEDWREQYYRWKSQQ